VLEKTANDQVIRSEKVTQAKSRQIEEARLRSETGKMEQLAEARINQQLPEHQTGTLRKVGNQVFSTLTSAGTGMATGYIIQRGVDAIGKYHNEGITPWRLSTKEADAQHERAIKTGSITAANAAASDLILPCVAQSRGYFEGLSGTALRNQALKGYYEASVAGGIAGAMTQISMAGYQYWQGNLSAGELAADAVDASGRSLFTTVGSIGGHALVPYSFAVPSLSSLLRVGNVGAVLGSVAGSVAYDTVKHYAKSGIQQISSYYSTPENIEPAAE